MNIKHSELYEAPTTEVVEVKIEGVVCQSIEGVVNNPDDFSFGDDPLNPILP